MAVDQIIIIIIIYIYTNANTNNTEDNREIFFKKTILTNEKRGEKTKVSAGNQP